MFSEDSPTFPPEELKNGHLIMCLTMDLATLNTMAVAIKQTQPNILKLFIPEKMKVHLPDWVKLIEPVPSSEAIKVSKTSV